MKWRALLKALAVAAGSGALTAVAQSSGDTPVTTETLAINALVGALIGGAAYLKQSPVEVKKPEPPPEK